MFNFLLFPILPTLFLEIQGFQCDVVGWLGKLPLQFGYWVLLKAGKALLDL
jgi:hypothetical protein